MGPLIGGFAFQYLGWRWIHWIILMLSGVSSLLMATVPETFKPALLRGKVAKMQKDTGDQRWWCVDDETETSFVRLRTSLIRPFSLTFNEPILWFWDFFIMINYSIVCKYRLTRENISDTDERQIYTSSCIREYSRASTAGRPVSTGYLTLESDLVMLSLFLRNRGYDDGPTS